MTLGEIDFGPLIWAVETGSKANVRGKNKPENIWKIYEIFLNILHIKNRKS